MSLIQQIRANQVLTEEKLNLPVKVWHTNDPLTIIGDREFALVFPKFMLDYQNEKDIDLLFVGLLTKKRMEFLSNFKKAVIIASNRGRNENTKKKDEDYFTLMSRTKFALCPNGDFIWTYRFFEAIIFKAIPIIQDFHPLYDGYKYYSLGDNLVYNEEWVNENLKRIKQKMFW